MILRDWREADPGLLRACYEAEWRSWREDLGWDSAWTWATVEQARVGGRLPGLIAVDRDGRVQGWTFSVLEGDTLHVGGLVAGSPAVTTRLLDAIVDAPTPGSRACFVRDRAPGLGEALVERGFDVERFLYLSRPLSSPDPSAPVVSGFSRTHAAAAAALLQSAYSPDASRHFAPHGTRGEWERYVASLVQQGGCGLLDEEASGLVCDEHGLQALALVTAIAPETAHLAQLAVRPDCRGRRLATDLLRHAMQRAARAGKTAMTLLVGEHNDPARALYAALGFTGRGTFIAARRGPASRSWNRASRRAAGGVEALTAGPRSRLADLSDPGRP